ncbi:hypothetical protein MOUN0_N12244 [Monosporozyma unispora]|nr:hypothetical protein C6P44_003359 [Kazachstania unispora]
MQFQTLFAIASLATSVFASSVANQASAAHSFMFDEPPAFKVRKTTTLVSSTIAKATTAPTTTTN